MSYLAWNPFSEDYQCVGSNVDLTLNSENLDRLCYRWPLYEYIFSSIPTPQRSLGFRVTSMATRMHVLSPFTAFDSCNERAGHTWLHLHQRWQIYPEIFICSNWRVSLLLQWIKHSKEVYFAPFSHICHYTVRLSQYFQPHFSQTHNKNVIILRKRMKYNCTITEN